MRRFVLLLGGTQSVVDWLAAHGQKADYHNVASWGSPGRSVPGWARAWLAKMSTERGIAKDDVPDAIAEYLRLFDG